MLKKKTLIKIQHPFVIIVLEISGIQGTCLKIIKAIYIKPIANRVKWRETQNNSIKIRNKTRLPTLCIPKRSEENKTREGNKRDTDKKWGLSNPLFRLYDSVHNRPWKFHQKTPRPDNHFHQSSKIQNQHTHKKSVIFLFTSENHTKRDQGNNSIDNSLKIIK